jgi:hypothetical protein
MRSINPALMMKGSKYLKSVVLKVTDISSIQISFNKIRQRRVTDIIIFLGTRRGSNTYYYKDPEHYRNFFFWKKSLRGAVTIWSHGAVPSQNGPEQFCSKKFLNFSF